MAWPWLLSGRGRCQTNQWYWEDEADWPAVCDRRPDPWHQRRCSNSCLNFDSRACSICSRSLAACPRTRVVVARHRAPRFPSRLPSDRHHQPDTTMNEEEPQEDVQFVGSHPFGIPLASELCAHLGLSGRSLLSNWSLMPQADSQSFIVFIIEGKTQCLTRVESSHDHDRQAPALHDPQAAARPDRPRGQLQSIFPMS